MLAKAIIVVMLMLGLPGCVTTKNDGLMKTELSQLQTRVCELEGELYKRDNEIERLNRQLETRREKSTASLKDSMPKTKKSQGGKESVAGKSAKNIQTALKNARYYKGPVDGKIGTRTKEAIKEFQRANGLACDGIVGKGTWLKLRQYLYPERSRA